MVNVRSTVIYYWFRSESDYSVLTSSAPPTTTQSRNTQKMYRNGGEMYIHNELDSIQCKNNLITQQTHLASVFVVVVLLV